MRTLQRKTLNRYSARFKKFGECIESIGWRNKEQQLARFQALIEIDDLRGKSILDVGCGFADLYAFLKEKEIDVEYTGFEIFPKFAEIAKKRHPECNIEIKDIFEEKPAQQYDFVFISGLFNKNMPDNDKYVKVFLEKAFEICKQGVAANMMSSYVDYKDKELHYYTPEEVFVMCRKISKRIALRHDFMPFEFAVFLYKNQERLSKSLVFKEFYKRVEAKK